MRYIICFIAFTCIPSFIRAQTPYNYYYLAIGSAHYEHRCKNNSDCMPQDEILPAITSAKIMEELFKKHIKARGKAIYSSNDKFITKKLIISSLDDLDSQIKKDNAPNPFVLFYYCGHGGSEDMTWMQFLLCGDFTLPPNRRLNIVQNENEFNNKIVLLNKIIEHFQNKKYQYIALIECCRHRLGDDSMSKRFYKLAHSKVDSLFDQGIKGLSISKEDKEKYKSQAYADFTSTMEDGLDSLKQENEFKQADPVVFASIPGKETDFVPFPNTQLIKMPIQNYESQVAPLCRRSILAFNAFYSSHKNYYTVGDFISTLTDNTFDQSSPAAISGYTDKSIKSKKLVLLTK